MVIWVDNVSALINTLPTMGGKLLISQVASAAYVHGGKGSQSFAPTE